MNEALRQYLQQLNTQNRINELEQDNDQLRRTIDKMQQVLDELADVIVCTHPKRLPQLSERAQGELAAACERKKGASQ